MKYSKKFMSRYGDVVADTYSKRFGRLISKIWYNLRPGVKDDPRKLLDKPFTMSSEHNKYIASLKKKSNNDKALAVFLFIRNTLKVRYVSDQSKHGTPEFWQDPQMTYDLRQGDCEDHTLLYLKLCDMAGIPFWMLRGLAGDVYTPDGTFGHCYPMYLDEDCFDWVTMDLTYYPNPAKVSERMPRRLDERYGGAWFQFNIKQAWSGKGARDWHEVEE